MKHRSFLKVYLPTLLSTLLFLGVIGGSYLMVDSSLQSVYRPSRLFEEAEFGLAQALQHALEWEASRDPALAPAARDAMVIVTARLQEIAVNDRADFGDLAIQAEALQMRLNTAMAADLRPDSPDWRRLLHDLSALQLNLAGESKNFIRAIRDRFYEAFDQLNVYVAASVLLGIALWLFNSFWLVPRYAVRPLEALLKAQREQELQVRQSEARMLAIANAVASGIVLSDENGLIKFWNPAAENLLGYTRDRALGAPLIEILRGADGEVLPCLVEAPQKGMRDHSLEELLVRGHDGCPLAVSLYYTTTTLDDSTHAVVVFRDISQERELRAELERHHAELQALYDNAPVLIGLVDETARILYGNPAFMAFTCPDGDSCLGARLGDALGCSRAGTEGCGSGAACATCHLRRAVNCTLENGDGPHEFEHHTVLRRGGEERGVTLMGTAVRLEGGEHARVLLCLQDITQRKQTEEALRLSEERMSLALEASTDGWWDWDLAGGHLFYSPRWWGMLGYAPGDLPADPDLWRRLTHPDDIDRVNGFFQNAVESGVARYEIEVRFLHADGHYVSVLSKGHFIRDEAGTAIRACGFNLDLSETKRREGEYESLIQTSMDGFWVADKRGRVLRVNHAVCDMLQYSELNLLQMNIVDLVADDSPSHVLERLEAIRYQGHDNFDAKLRCKDGSLIDVEGSVTTRPEAEGQLFGFVRDITARKAWEASLQASEARFRSYIEHAPIGALVVDRMGRYLEANHAAAEHLGYTREELLNLSIRDLRVDEFEALADDHFQTVLRGEKSAIEVLLRRKDGSMAPTEVHASRIDEDRFLGFHVDLSERKKAEAVVLHQAALDAVLAEVSRAMVAKKEGESIEDLLLRHAMRLTESPLCGIFLPGEQPGEITLVRPGASPRTIPKREDALDGATPDLELLESFWSMQGRVLAPSTFELPSAESGGSSQTPEPQTWILALPILQGEEWLGQIILARFARAYSATDLTALGRLAELYRLHLHGARIRRELETSRQQFLQAQKLEAVGRLAGGVAHDFNNILGVIIGYSEFALRNPDCNSELREHLDSMHRAALRGADLTRQLLAFARKQTVQPRKLDLNENVAAMLKLLGKLAGERITIHWHPLNRALPIEIDPSQLDQLLANLIVNARDAMAGCGTVTIATGFEFVDQHRGTLLESGWKPGPCVILSVSDTGCGIDADTLNHIFEPFFTTKPEGQGTGLGLATVHGIVHQNGGFVVAESEPDMGTTFRIYLPLLEGGDQDAPAAADHHGSDPSGTETILLVDDQGDFRDACRTILESLGYRVITARNGDDALRALNGDTEKIHLLITDLVMPGMNGRDLWAHMSARCPRLRCIYMSGYTADVIGEQGVLDENVCFIDKPFSMSTLARRIREVLDA